MKPDARLDYRVCAPVNPRIRLEEDHVRDFMENLQKRVEAD